MLFMFSTPVLIRHLWQLKTIVFLHWIGVLYMFYYNREALACGIGYLRTFQHKMYYDMCCRARDKTRCVIVTEV